MAQRDGRRRARESSRDPRSAERARRAPRRHVSSGKSAVSVTETGEQEIHHDDLDLVDEIDPNADPASGDRDRVDAAARGSQRGRDRVRRRPGPVESLAMRLRGLDAKRAVVLALVISAVALTLAVPMRNYFAGHSEFEQIAQSNAQLREQVAHYQQKVNEQGDPAYIEAQARARLQLVRPGEIPLVMMYPGDAARRAAQEEAQQHARNPWYGNLWDSVATPPTDR